MGFMIQGFRKTAGSQIKDSGTLLKTPARLVIAPDSKKHLPKATDHEREAA